MDELSEAQLHIEQNVNAKMVFINCHIRQIALVQVEDKILPNHALAIFQEVLLTFTSHARHLLAPQDVYKRQV